MRLIDADELYQEAENRSEKMNGYFNELSRVITAWDINHAPTIDAVQVVRCVDCDCFSKTIYPSGTIIGYCAFNKHPVMPEDYCSCGERKEVNETD